MLGLVFCRLVPPPNKRPEGWLKRFVDKEGCPKIFVEEGCPKILVEGGGWLKRLVVTGWLMKIFPGFDWMFENRLPDVLLKGSLLIFELGF